MGKLKRAILIAGPTASGKSSAALALARALDGVIVNADSMQVYSGLRVLTARPSPADEAAAPHALYGHADPAMRYSAGQWLAEARKAARDAWDKGLIPIFTGGTGLYFRALEEGLADIPSVPAALRDELMARDTPALRAQAAGLGLDAGLDRQRLIRAICVKRATGRALEDFHKGGGQPPAPLAEARVLRVLAAPPRDVLRERIARRFAVMMEQGAADEVRALMARRLDPSLPAMKALGVRPIARALSGEISMREAEEETITRTRQYAKRQMTWARKFMAGWPQAEEARKAADMLLGLARARGWC